MISFFIGCGVVLLLLMLPILYRVVAGPTAIDRIVAINVIGTKTAVLLVIIGIVFGQGRVEMFVDFALAYALLNFIGSLAAARYLRKTLPMAGGAEPVPGAEEASSHPMEGGAGVPPVRAVRESGGEATHTGGTPVPPSNPAEPAQGGAAS